MAKANLNQVQASHMKANSKIIKSQVKVLRPGKLEKLKEHSSMDQYTVTIVNTLILKVTPTKAHSNTINSLEKAN